MGMKPAKVYRNTDKKAYTREEYVKGVPQSRITSFEMGEMNREYELEFYLMPERDCQITHNALEAARIACNRFLNKKIGGSSYFMKIRIYPHQILRENKIAMGAGADRISQGMSHAFGLPVGRAARVKKNQKIISIYVASSHADFAKQALKRAARKFPIPCRIYEEYMRKR